ncbi:MAG: autotransporter outer membrane beta-barrel domain-containing protein [Putridiphycobacter sp.]
MILNSKYIYLIVFSFLTINTYGQFNPKEKIHIKGYGAVNYYYNDWDTDPERRNQVDLERLNIYFMYHFNERIMLKTEFEIEHGGTGATMEFDKFEEFGEFESSVESGGEVLLEQLHLYFKYKPWLNIRAGNIKVYLGVAAKNDEATEYFTGYRSEMENAILPLGWYETGIELSGVLKEKWSYQAYLVNGLSSEGFNSSGWIKDGHQTAFETKNANNLATALRFDRKLPNDSWIGVGAYTGNTINNRQKPDLDGLDGRVSIADFHLSINLTNWAVRGMFMYGHLNNADKITAANQNLSNNLNVKRTPVGSDMMGYFLEVGYDLLSLSKTEKTQKLFVFTRYDYYDSMYKVEQGIFDNPRWERTVLTGGLNFMPTEDISIKTHYAHRILGTTEIERYFTLGLGFKFNSRK